MKVCPACNREIAEDAVFCPLCGAQLGGEPKPNYAPYQPAYDPYDHTAEYDQTDISENKVFAMICYLLSGIGIIIALLASQTSPYVKFHVRQALKLTVTEILSVLVVAVLCWTIVVPLLGGIFLCVLTVVKLICFFQVCGGKAKEAPVVRSFSFLK